MHNGSKVYFKATRDNIFVVMDGTAEFDEIKASLLEKAKDAKRFFGNSSAFIVFKGRALSERQEDELVHIIEDQTNLKVYVAEEKQDWPPVNIKEVDRVPLNDSLTESPLPRPSFMDMENLEGAVFYRGSLRSGMCIESEGSVVVVGDVNPGGEIIAGGNIVVLGALKGLAHAGAYGDSNAFVAAISLQPVQLRIANIITTVAEELDKQGKSAGIIPSYAYIAGERIYIAPLV